MHDQTITGICNLSIIPVRVQPSEKSEMVTQLLFGELYSLLDRLNGWILISSWNDQYEGWIDEKLFHEAEESFLNSYTGCNVTYTDDIVTVARNSADNQAHYLVRGSVLPLYQDGKFSINQLEFTTQGNVICQHIPSPPDQLIESAMKYLGVPYLWGGRSPFGIDCSGFVQSVFRLGGYSLPRDASQQVQSGEVVDFISAVQAGDLAFFENSQGSITHVGILLNPQQIIHASGNVRIDPVDHQGIFNQALGKYTHALRIIKRVI